MNPLPISATRPFIATIFLVGTLVAGPAHADVGGSCHFHGSKPAAESIVIGCATQRKDALVKAGKLAPSWQAVRHDRIESVDGKKGKEWKITFRDPAATDPARQTLYLFYTLPGNFIAANFTGQ